MYVEVREESRIFGNLKKEVNQADMGPLSSSSSDFELVRSKMFNIVVFAGKESRMWDEECEEENYPSRGKVLRLPCGRSTPDG